MARAPRSRREALALLAVAAAAPPVLTGGGAKAASSGGAVEARNGVAAFSLADFAQEEGGLAAAVRLPARPPRRRLAAAKASRGPAGETLRALLRAGAAGNHGDLYDNRDRDHATLRPNRHPTLTFVEYAEDARAEGLDYGLNDRIRFDAPTIGNSSTAITGSPIWRSQPRMALTSGRAPALSRLYGANHLYVYPEHRDHDPEHGDVFPAAAPFFIVSQGSSGSDQRFLRALAGMLAAMRPAAKTRLREEGLIAPTLQMLLRRNMAGIETDEDYLSGAAHPTAFDRAAIELPRMLRAAHALEPDALPPRAALAVVGETQVGGAIFADGFGERLFDTPDAAARVARGAHGLRRYRLSATGSRDPNGRALRFHWRVLRGPGAAVRAITASGDMAEAAIPWTEPYVAPGPAALTTRRVDIAVFADNGVHLSAPAFFSLAFPPGQRRRYAPDGAPLEIDYAPAEAEAVYSDPLLFPRRPWRDVYARDAGGRAAGWTRFFLGGAQEDHTAHGLRVLARDAAGRPSRAEALAYPAPPGPRRVRTVAPTPTGAVFAIAYADESDRVGVPRAE